MRRTKIWYWIITSLFGGYMLFTAIPNVIADPESMKFITGLGYPDYFVRFIGVMKVLGVIAILIPGFHKIKEWAYAGLFFDLLGATWSIVNMYGVDVSIIFMILPIIFLFWSRYLYNKAYSAEPVKSYI